MFGGSLRTRLLALTLLLVLPTFFFLFIGNFKRQDSERKLARERASSFAKLAAANELQYVRLARQQLATMSQIPLVLTPDRAVAEKGLKTIRRILPDFEDFGMIEPDGKLFCDSIGTNASSFTPDLFKKVTATRDFAASVFYPPSATNTPTLQFGLPVMTNGAIARILFASLRSSRLSDALTNIVLPEGGALTVFDRNANVLARLPDADNWLGRQSASNTFIQRIFHRDSDVFESPGLDGVERLYAVSEVADRANTILLITVGTPRRDVFAAADHELIVSTVLVLLLAALLLALAWWYSERQFIRPTLAITQAADRISEGDLSARTGLPPQKSELHRIAQRFDQMAANLERRRAELEQAHGQILSQNAELERRVAERTKELEAINSELEAFSYSVSHDLRAPLRHMNGFAQLLVKNPKIQEDPKTQRQLAVIIDAAKRMGTLIDDLLSFSRMGRQSLSKSQVNSNEMVKEVVAEVLAREPDRQIEWKIDALPAVHADAAMLRQVWINLISNAVKYSRQKNPAVIEIKSEQTAAEIIFSIKDNGAGFDMAYIDKLFGVFQRLHHEQEFEGTGIGLANVRRIVARHGGNVWAEGKPGEGATFSFSLANNPQKIGNA
jgi:signal transduction histidine kinase